MCEKAEDGCPHCWHGVLAALGDRAVLRAPGDLVAAALASPLADEGGEGGAPEGQPQPKQKQQKAQLAKQRQGEQQQQGEQQVAAAAPGSAGKAAAGKGRAAGGGKQAAAAAAVPAGEVTRLAGRITNACIR